MEQALSGIRVLDFSSYIAGPYAAMLLAEQGADVVKVERPSGDPYRSSAGFIVLNRSKKGITLDLKNARGKQTARDLIKGADVLIESYRPGVAERLGIGYEQAREVNPGLVYCSINGFGSKGPYRDRAGWDDAVMCTAAIYADSLAESDPPTYWVQPVASYFAAPMAAFGVISALYVREETGKGQKVDMPLLAAMAHGHCTHLVDMKGRRRIVNDHPQGGAPLFKLYKCADGRWIMLTIGNMAFFVKLAKVMGHEEWLADPVFEGAPWLIPAPRNKQAIALIEPIFASKTLNEWLKILGEADIPCAPVNYLHEFMNDEQVIANEMVAEVDEPGLGLVREMDVPVKLSLTPGRIKGRSPRLGEHTDSVLKEMSRPYSKPNHSPGRGQLSDETKTGALHGLRVVDFTTMGAGPAATELLAEMGADVIKIEPPDGDPFRAVPASFLGLNQGKRSLAIDLKREESAGIISRLISASAVVAENSRPNVMERLGLDYETLRKKNPGLVYMGTRGHGSVGPRSNEPSYDGIAQALGGTYAAQGGEGNPPFLLKCAISDSSAALYGALGVALSLYARHRTGKGQMVETSLTNAIIAMQAGDFIDYKGIKRPQVKNPDMRGPHALRRLYEGSDRRWFLITCSKESHWASLCRVHGLEVLAGDAKFGTSDARTENESSLVAALQRVFREKRAADWVAELERANVPAVMALTLDETIYDENMETDKIFVNYEHPQLGKVRTVGLGPRLSETQRAIEKHPPLLGEHTDEILGELGYSPEEITRFKEKKIVYAASQA